MSADENGWLPIETAPKDGRIMLLYLPWINEVRQGRFNPGHRRARRGWFAALYNHTNSFLAGEPTHWQPLPKPPVTP